MLWLKLFVVRVSELFGRFISTLEQGTRKRLVDQNDKRYARSALMAREGDARI